MDITLSAPSFCRQISPEEFEFKEHMAPRNLWQPCWRKSSQMPNSPAKKRRKIEAVSKSYPEVYQERFPTPESEALLFPENLKQNHSC